MESVRADFGVSPEIAAFKYTPGTEVVFGEGVIGRIGELAAGISSGPWLIVTDPGIVASGHLDVVKNYLVAAGLEVAVYDSVHENPTTDDVTACLARAEECGARALIGLGGGSSMDTAKACNFILTNGGEMKDYWGVGKAAKPMLPLVAVPTTAGTGSECQSFALIADAATHQKMACGDKKAAARIALLDPVLTLTQPPSVTAHTGIDAVAHALETAVTRKRTPVSSEYSRLAFGLLERSLPAVLERPDDLAARAEVQLGAAYAGTAIENSMLGAAHSAANPLTARFGIVHGAAVGVMLPHVIRLNSTFSESAAAYSKIFEGDLAARAASLLDAAGIRPCLKDYGVEEGDIPSLAASAAGQWTAQFNPVELDAARFESLYSAAW